MFCGVFVEDKKLDSNLHIWRLQRDTSVYISGRSRVKNLDFCSAFEISFTFSHVFSFFKTKNLDFCSAFEISFTFSHVFSFFKTNGLPQYQITINNTFLIRSGIL